MIALADKGWKRALTDDVHLRRGLNVCMGQVTHEAVALATGFPWRDPDALIG